MQPLPQDFLEKYAADYDLSDEQTDALVQRLSNTKATEAKAAAALHISVNALRNRMSGVYKKFSISGKGPGKLRRLHDFLLQQYQGTQPNAPITDDADSDIDQLVQDIRQAVHGDIQQRCGTMRVLDMEQPIGLGDIYTSVNILEKLSGRQRLGVTELWEGCTPENFDRLLLGKVQQERILGLDAVKQHSKLMILGKPGAGKSTFMKRLATLCNKGKFQAQRVPVFVTLKEFAEAEGAPSLRDYIAEQWQRCEVDEATEAVTTVLQSGRGLLLLDGLDEVLETELSRVLQTIKTDANQFRDCQIVMTCRIAAREYTFEQFTEVEVADFNGKQIADFATKWFASKEDLEKGKTFIQRLQGNKPIKELATNPLLLTLLCLVFGDAADFPANRSELYKEGLDVLLKKWDAKRNIQRDQIYKKLSLKRKEDLLSQLAFSTFDKGDYFFKQIVVERHIVDYIQNLPGASDDEETLQLDSEAVLKSIEAQHGLLVERARSIYSFSHLTFQEYFAAKHITRPIGQLHTALEDLASHIADKRYHEIFLLAIGMLPKADELLKLMKQHIDTLPDEPVLRQILKWSGSKARSVQSLDQNLTMCRFYLARASVSTLELILNRSLDLSLAPISTRARALNGSLTSAIKKCQNSQPDLAVRLEQLKSELPALEKLSKEKRLQWWQNNGERWTTSLRTTMIEHCNIGHDWQLTDEQQQKLQQYDDANEFLLKCLNSDCYVTKATRQEIEETAFFPMADLEARI